MKKTILLAAIVFLLAACEKQSSEIQNNYPSNYPGVSLQSGYKQTKEGKETWIKFESLAAYDSILETLAELDEYGLYIFDSTLEFSSMLTTKSEKERDTIGLYDDLFAALLSPEGYIQIEDTLIYMDFDAQEAYFYDEELENLYRIVAFNEEAWPEEEELDENGDPKGQRYKHECENYLNNNYYCSKVVYQRLAVYFSLLAKTSEFEISFNHQSFSLGNIDKSLISRNGNYYIKKRSSTTHPIQPMSKFKRHGSVSYRPYYGSKKLKEFLYIVDFYNAVGSIETSYSLSVYKN